MTYITQNFELILFIAILLTGVISLLDILFFAKKRAAESKQPAIIDYSRSFFPVLLFVFLLRSFVVEPYRIPSGSLKPTLAIGDFIVVNKFIYGLRFPVWHKKFLAIKEPERGDLIVFRYPPNPSIDYIKRVIGVPGDHIVYTDKILTINGKKMPQKFISYNLESEPGYGSWKVEKIQENLDGIKHHIYVRPDVSSGDFDVTVPEGQYFAMGDNRDSSLDSRAWGFVPEENIIGEAFCVLISWDENTDSIRWSRIGKLVH